MDSLRLLFDVLFAFGITYTLVSSKIAEGLRAYLTGGHVIYPDTKDPLNSIISYERYSTVTHRFFRGLFACYFCTGFWASLFVAGSGCLVWPVFVGTTAQYVFYTVGFGFAGATACYTIDVLLKYWENV